MYKIGLVGGAGAWHGKTFAEMFNGYKKREAVKKGWAPLYTSRVAKDARITHVWDEDPNTAAEIADICHIKNIVGKMEDMIGSIDGAILADDKTLKHQKRAGSFLKAGLPVFIDKPLSPDIREAEEIINLAARRRAPLMSCSAMRYAKEVETFKRELPGLGEIITGNAICGGDLVYYGIHACELLQTLVGPGVTSVRNVGGKGKNIVLVKYRDGRDFILTVYKDTKYLFQANLYCRKGWRQVNVTDSNYYYSATMKQFMNMVRTRKEPIPLKETLEIIKVLILGEKSLKTRKEIKL